MRRVYLTLSCGVTALGLVHIAATARHFPALTQAALWFLSGGLFMVLVGAQNLLNRSYGAVAPGLRWVSVAANAVITLFALTAGLVGPAGALELSVVVGLLAANGVLSALPHSVIAPSASGEA